MRPYMTIDMKNDKPRILFSDLDEKSKKVIFDVDDIAGMADFICQHNIEHFMHSSIVDWPEDAEWPEDLVPNEILNKVYEEVNKRRGFQLLLPVKKIVVMIRQGTDLVYVDTACPSPFPPSVSDEPLSMKFEVTKGHGVQYVKDVFDVEPEVLDTSKNSGKERE